MTLSDLLRAGGRVALDTMCFLYTFEANPSFVVATRKLFSAIESGRLQATVSILALTECLTLPLREGREDLAASYRQVFDSFPHLSCVPIGPEIADLAARLRARHALRMPDALHVATAIVVGAPLVTADARLARLPEVDVVILEPARRSR